MEKKDLPSGALPFNKEQLLYEIDKRVEAAVRRANYPRFMQVLGSQGQHVRINITDIHKVLYANDRLIFRMITDQRRGLHLYRSLTQVEEKLSRYGFVRANNFCLINPGEVISIDEAAHLIKMTGDDIDVEYTRTYKKEVKSIMEMQTL